MKGYKSLQKNAGEFIVKAGKRALHTGVQCSLAMIGTATMMNEVNWAALASTVCLAVIVSIGKSILVGLPEMED